MSVNSEDSGATARNIAVTSILGCGKRGCNRERCGKADAVAVVVALYVLVACNGSKRGEGDSRNLSFRPDECNLELFAELSRNCSAHSAWRECHIHCGIDGDNCLRPACLLVENRESYRSRRLYCACGAIGLAKVFDYVHKILL